ncbi:cellulase family glycosylhydrolase [Haloplasma contractile]|uniref:Cellulase domain containing protein n=1 Tax=Haloplasma contractile SSD-17B TaxID=1033810 RepID=U2FJH1_9MOLU|nr:cellulase family glycosylhydrolase [Haloplasma contractile]ERJ11409.1 Cellulase domain containing protein [Haloplasma contractile SSD-17B]
MGKTNLSIKGRDFYINDKPVYDEIEGSGSSKGLLMNARFIQGIFDDQSDRERFNRFYKIFDADAHTDDFISALPKWYEYGLRAVTVGIQGGMPVFTIDVETIDNNPFGTDGVKLDEAYARRLDKIIKAADDLGMVVIVNILYWAQTLRLSNDDAIMSALKCAASFLKEGGYTNVIIDVANEYNIDMWKDMPLVKNPDSMQQLINLVRKESGGMLVGASGGGGLVDKEVVKASDVVIVHGNGLTRGEYYDFILKVQEMAPNKPILCNEDSPCISRLEIAKLTHTSWGHYDNFTKQEPPCDWSITEGHDLFFARRMATSLGIKVPELRLEDQFYLQGLENNTHWQGKRWIRLAAEYPERIDYVNFYRNDEFIYRSYDEPFFMYRETTWIQKPWKIKKDDKKWTAEVVLNDGTTVIKSVTV